MVSETSTATTRRPKGRSPAYPAISLETAIQRARQLHDKERGYATPVGTIAAHWGYNSLNGPALGALAALKKYGLLEDEGASEDRKARLSDLADVILVHPSEARRKTAIQEAALRPPVHREMWEKYHERLPSDSNLRWELTRDRGFTERGAGEFLRVYRATITFAQLTSSGLITSEGEADELDSESNDDINILDPEESKGRELGRSYDLTSPTRAYPIPLIGGGVVTVSGEFPIGERDWDQFMAVLAAMKPGLVRNELESTE